MMNFHSHQQQNGSSSRPPRLNSSNFRRRHHSETALAFPRNNFNNSSVGRCRPDSNNAINNRRDNSIVGSAGGTRPATSTSNNSSRRNSRRSSNSGGTGGSIVISDKYEIRDIVCVTCNADVSDRDHDHDHCEQHDDDKFDHNDGECEDDHQQQMRKTISRASSMKASASSRLKLRELLLHDSRTSQDGFDAPHQQSLTMEEGNTHRSPPQERRASLRSVDNYSQHTSSLSCNDYTSPRTTQSMDNKSNEEWPELNSSSNKHHTNTRSSTRTKHSINSISSLSIGDSNLDLQFNNALRHRVNRRSSMPNTGIKEQDGQQQQLGYSTNTNNSNSIMADYIALKLNVAELQSELQVAQIQAKNHTQGLQQAQTAMTDLQERNDALSKRNSELEEENCFYLNILGKLEQLGRLEGLEDECRFKQVQQQQQQRLLGKKNNSWVKNELDWGTISDSDRVIHEDLKKITMTTRTMTHQVPMKENEREAADIAAEVHNSDKKRSNSWWDVVRNKSAAALDRPNRIESMQQERQQQRRNSTCATSSATTAKTNQDAVAGTGSSTRRRRTISKDSCCGHGEVLVHGLPLKDNTTATTTRRSSGTNNLDHSQRSSSSSFKRLSSKASSHKSVLDILNSSRSATAANEEDEQQRLQANEGGNITNSNNPPPSPNTNLQRSKSWASSWIQRSSGGGETSINSNKDQKQQQQHRRNSLVETMMKTLPETLYMPRVAHEGVVDGNGCDHVQAAEEQNHQQQHRPVRQQRLQRRRYLQQHQPKGNNDSNNPIVPEYVKFTGDEGHLRCSDLTFDIHASSMGTHSNKEEVEEGKKKQCMVERSNAQVMSDIDVEQGRQLKLLETNTTTTKTTADHCSRKNKNDNDERKQYANSEMTNFDDNVVISVEGGESFALWTSMGPLGYSVTASHLDNESDNIGRAPLTPVRKDQATSSIIPHADQVIATGDRTPRTNSESLLQKSELLHRLHQLKSDS